MTPPHRRAQPRRRRASGDRRAAVSRLYTCRRAAARRTPRHHLGKGAGRRPAPPQSCAGPTPAAVLAPGPQSRLVERLPRFRHAASPSLSIERAPSLSSAAHSPRCLPIGQRRLSPGGSRALSPSLSLSLSRLSPGGSRASSSRRRRTASTPCRPKLSCTPRASPTSPPRTPPPSCPPPLSQPREASGRSQPLVCAGSGLRTLQGGDTRAQRGVDALARRVLRGANWTRGAGLLEPCAARTGREAQDFSSPARRGLDADSRSPAREGCRRRGLRGADSASQKPLVSRCAAARLRLRLRLGTLFDATSTHGHAAVHSTSLAPSQPEYHESHR